MSPQQTFAKLDQNHDGQLTFLAFTGHHLAPPTAKPATTTPPQHKVEVE